MIVGLAALAAVLGTGLSDQPPATPTIEPAVAEPEPEDVRRSLPRPLTLAWTYERQEDDTPLARSCSPQNGSGACVAVACRRDHGLTFEYFGPGKPSADGGLAGGTVFVSTLHGVKRVEILWSLQNQPFSRRAPLSTSLTNLLEIGGRGLYEDEERKLPFTLEGSAAAIAAVKLRCR